MHVVKEMTVERPVTPFIGGQVELRAAAGLDRQRMFERLTVGRSPVHEFEEVSVQMDRMRHHGVVDELDAHALVIGKLNRLGDLVELLPVERSHIQLHIAG